MIFVKIKKYKKIVLDFLTSFLGNKDKRGLKKITEELRRSQQRYYSIFNIAMNLIILVDKNADVIDCNNKSKDFLGYEKEEFIGLSVKKYVHPDYWEEAEVTIDKLINKKEVVSNKEYKFVKKDGTNIFVKINSSAVYDENDNFLHTICILTDITEDKLLSEELVKSNERLQEFAYIASHDLQEPLRTVASYCQLLQDRCSTVIDVESKEYLAYAIDATLRMRVLIKELLDFSRVGSEKEKFEKLNMNKLAEEAITDFTLFIEEKRAVISVEDLPEIIGVNSRIRQLLHNLVSNALKFSGDKKPNINISCCEAEDGNWLFCVRDNGVGIDNKYYDKIFGIFKRLYTRDQYPGTGIGLAICKKIVESHGGRIWVESEEGKGSNFYFSISKNLKKENDLLVKNNFV